jgi:hypothetical protein
MFLRKRPLTFNGLHGIISQKIVIHNDDSRQSNRAPRQERYLHTSLPGELYIDQSSLWTQFGMASKTIRVIVETHPTRISLRY